MKVGIMKPMWTECEVMPCQSVDILVEELEDETCASDSHPAPESELSESGFLLSVGRDSDIVSYGDDY